MLPSTRLRNLCVKKYLVIILSITLLLGCTDENDPLSDCEMISTDLGCPSHLERFIGDYVVFTDGCTPVTPLLNQFDLSVTVADVTTQELDVVISRILKKKLSVSAKANYNQIQFNSSSVESSALADALAFPYEGKLYHNTKLIIDGTLDFDGEAFLGSLTISVEDLADYNSVIFRSTCAMKLLKI